MERKFDDECSRKRAEYFAKLKEIQPFSIQDKVGEVYSTWIPIDSKNEIEIAKLGKIIISPEVHRTRIDCELVIDFDNKSIARNLDRSCQVQNYLLVEWGIKSSRWFSGNKGVHLHAFILNIKRKQMLGLFFRISQNFKTKIDKGVMEAVRHMIRGEYSLNSKSGFIKEPLDETAPVTTYLTSEALEELDFIADANRVMAKRSYSQYFSKKGEHD